MWDKMEKGQHIHIFSPGYNVTGSEGVFSMSRGEDLGTKKVSNI